MYLALAQWFAPPTHVLSLLDHPGRAIGDADTSDAALAAERDIDAFGRLFVRHSPDIHRLARRMLGDWDADDATQDVFMRVWDKVSLYRGESTFKTWLYRLAINLIVRRAATAGRDLRRTDSLEAKVHEIASTPIDTEIDVATALDRLEPQLRHVVVLFYMEGYSHDEIGELLGIGVSASRMRLHRARLTLRNLLDP